MSIAMAQIPCINCPWRVTTKTEDIPGGGMELTMCADSARGRIDSIAMLCHRTEKTEVCAGFALSEDGMHHMGLRMALIQKTVHGPYPDFPGDIELHPTFKDMMKAHE